MRRINHFKNAYRDKGLTNIIDQASITGLFPKIISDREAELLFAPCTKEEIWKALNTFKKDKSLGPDGWTVEFYLHFFDLISDDLWELVENSRLRGTIYRALNSTFLTLIPKSNNPNSFSDFRPIALCNLCYKLITKLWWPTGLNRSCLALSRRNNWASSKVDRYWMLLDRHKRYYTT
jgi:hypothetical protein